MASASSEMSELERLVQRRLNGEDDMDTDGEEDTEHKYEQDNIEEGVIVDQIEYITNCPILKGLGEELRLDLNVVDFEEYLKLLLYARVAVDKLILQKIAAFDSAEMKKEYVASYRRLIDFYIFIRNWMHLTSSTAKMLSHSIEWDKSGKTTDKMYEMPDSFKNSLIEFIQEKVILNTGTKVCVHCILELIAFLREIYIYIIYL